MFIVILSCITSFKQVVNNYIQYTKEYHEKDLYCYISMEEKYLYAFYALVHVRIYNIVLYFLIYFN